MMHLSKLLTVYLRKIYSEVTVFWVKTSFPESLALRNPWTKAISLSLTSFKLSHTLQLWDSFCQYCQTKWTGNSWDISRVTSRLSPPKSETDSPFSSNSQLQWCSLLPLAINTILKRVLTSLELHENSDWIYYSNWQLFMNVKVFFSPFILSGRMLLCISSLFSPPVHQMQHKGRFT